jgi:hypothetical protein
MSDGHCVYQGEAKESARYFRTLGFKLPTFSNPADTYMRILAVGYPKNEKDERKLNFFMEHYDKRMKADVEAESNMVQLAEPNMGLL